MSNNIIVIQDNDGNTYYPKTSAKAVVIGEQDETVESSINDLKTRMDDFETNSGTATDTEISNIKSRLSTAETNISSTKSRVSTAESDISQAESNISGLKTRMTTAETNITSVKSRLDTAEDDISQAETDISELETRMTDAENNAVTLSDLTNGITELTVGKRRGGTGSNSVSVGESNYAVGKDAIASGYEVITADYMSGFGKFNTSEAYGPSSPSDTSGSLFVIGCGTSASSRSNAFRVGADGNCYGKASFKSSGADYAKFFEWVDGNPSKEDRRGLFVALDGNKIKLASPDDDVIGVISANPAYVEDVQSESWHEMYLKDVFGTPIRETVLVPETTTTKIVTIPESIDEETGETIPAHEVEVEETIPEHEEVHFKLNPDYDPSREYISREFRTEWDMVGLFGTLVAVDDGTCEINGYSTVGQNGVATKSETKTRYRVMTRIDDNHIELFLGF